MNFDQILQHSGGSGRALMIFVLMTIVNQMIISLPTLGHIFMKGDDNYRCLIPTCENETSANYKAQWLNYTIPYEHDAKTDKSMLSRCKMYDLNDTYDEQCDLDAFDDTSSRKCDKWVYSLPQMTLNKQWDLVCSRNYLLDLSLSVYAVGFLLGALASGLISDKIGRRKTILMSIVIQVSGSVIVIFSPNIYFYMAVRFFIAASGISLVSTLFVLLAEFCDSNSRVYTSLSLIGWQIGNFILIGLAYFIRDWRYMQTAMCVTTLLYILHFRFILESPRWLISQRRYDEAKEVLRTFARWQKTEISDDFLDEHFKKHDTKETGKFSLLSLFRTAEIRKRFIIIAFIWFTDSLVAYSLAYGAGNLPGSIYVNFTFMVIADFAGSICSVLFVKYIHRKLCMGLAFLTIGIVCLCNVFASADQEFVIIGLAVAGIFSISIAFKLTYVYTAELFPTVIRSSALGSASTCSRFGGIASPFIASLVNVWRPLPTLIMGIAGLLACFLVTFLPETFDCELPTSIEEIENGAKEKIFNKDLSWNRKSKDVSIELKSVSYKINNQFQ